MFIDQRPPDTTNTAHLVNRHDLTLGVLNLDVLDTVQDPNIWYFFWQNLIKNNGEMWREKMDFMIKIRD